MEKHQTFYAKGLAIAVSILFFDVGQYFHTVGSGAIWHSVSGLNMESSCSVEQNMADSALFWQFMHPYGTSTRKLHFDGQLVLAQLIINSR